MKTKGTPRTDAPREPSEPAPWRAAVDAAIATHRQRPGGLMPLLQELQSTLRHIPSGAISSIADAFNLSVAEVHGVITYYHDFRSEPAGTHSVKVCRAEACQSVGADALVAHACRKLGVEMHGTTKDGRVSLDPVYCLGNCALSPAVMVDGTVHGMVDAPKLDALIDALDGKGGAR